VNTRLPITWFLWRSRRGRILLLLLATLVVVPAAYGYWTATGSGAGTATAGNPQAVVINPGTTATQSLYPTGTALGDVTVSISNPNTFKIHIASLSLDTSQGTGGFSTGSCALSFTQQSNGGIGWTVPAGNGTTNGSLSLDLTNSLTMGTSAASSCQGQAFTVYLKTP
jgi:hypothetical protein